MKLPPFESACPTTLPEAVQLLAARDDAKALAGGQSLVPMLAFRLLAPTLLVDLRKLADLRGIGDRAPATQGGNRACGALSDTQSRHGRRQPRACRSRRGDAGHCADLRG